MPPSETRKQATTRTRSDFCLKRDSGLAFGAHSFNVSPPPAPSDRLHSLIALFQLGSQFASTQEPHYRAPSSVDLGSAPQESPALLSPPPVGTETGASSASLSCPPRLNCSHRLVTEFSGKQKYKDHDLQRLKEKKPRASHLQ